jgi:hypothetical protein
MGVDHRFSIVSRELCGGHSAAAYRVFISYTNRSLSTLKTPSMLAFTIAREML